jgi:hypothetical protein
MPHNELSLALLIDCCDGLTRDCRVLFDCKASATTATVFEGHLPQ